MDSKEISLLTYAVADNEMCLLVKMGPYRILLDCGLKDISYLLTEQKKPADLVIVSHAHSDHARGLLNLHRKYPQLPIYASEVTTELLHLNWLDEGENPRFCQALPWRTPIEFAEGLYAELFSSGHLPGAASILLTYNNELRDYTVFYTGDFFLSNSRLAEGLHLEELRGLKPDVLILEGSYGTSRHPHRRQQENQLAERINQAITENNSVILPVPTLGLGQELLMLLRSHHLFTGRDLDIWVDGSVAAGCDIYLQLLQYLPNSVQNFARNQPLFWDERVRPRVRRLLPEQKELLGQIPCIIMTDEDADFSEYLKSGNWVLLIAQQPGHEINTDSGLFTRVETYLLAQHSDGLGTTQLIHNLRPQHIVFVHSSPTYLADLTSLEELRNRYQLHSPGAGYFVELPVGEVFLQPSIPNESNYQGQLTEFDDFISMTLPTILSNDPRWQSFSDTGFIEVRWQGEELVIRGISQKEVLNQFSVSKISPDVECCVNCSYYRGQKCYNFDSPLYSFKVTPDGVCPFFAFPDN